MWREGRRSSRRERDRQVGKVGGGTGHTGALRVTELGQNGNEEHLYCPVVASQDEKIGESEASEKCCQLAPSHFSRGSQH